MKIAVWHNLPSGGGKRALYCHVRGLQTRGHTIEAWRPSIADAHYLPLSELVVEHIDPFGWSAVRPRNALAAMFWWYRKLPAQMRAMDEHCRRCAEQINRSGCDVLLANSCWIFAAAPIAKYVH